VDNHVVSDGFLVDSFNVKTNDQAIDVAGELVKVTSYKCLAVDVRQVDFDVEKALGTSAVETWLLQRYCMRRFRDFFEAAPIEKN
jgi:hypothetical protein